MLVICFLKFSHSECKMYVDRLTMLVWLDFRKRVAMRIMYWMYFVVNALRRHAMSAASYIESLD